MYQRCLIPPELISPRTQYEKLFENLPEVPFGKSQRGRTPIPRQSLLKGLIYRNLRGIRKLVELEFELLNNPSMAEPLGLNPLKKPPSDERFSDFLRSNPNGYFQAIRKALARELIREGVISGTGIALDSCPIEATVKEKKGLP